MASGQLWNVNGRLGSIPVRARRSSGKISVGDNRDRTTKDVSLALFWPRGKNIAAHGDPVSESCFPFSTTPTIS